MLSVRYHLMFVVNGFVCDICCVVRGVCSLVVSCRLMMVVARCVLSVVRC